MYHRQYLQDTLVPTHRLRNTLLFRDSRVMAFLEELLDRGGFDHPVMAATGIPIQVEILRSLEKGPIFRHCLFLPPSQEFSGVLP